MALAPEIKAALEAALPIVERAASAQPTTLSRHLRQQEASKVAKQIRDLLAAA